MEIIGSGTYGCVYYPGFNCNGKINKTKKVTKISNDEIGVKSESEIGKIIKDSVKKYKNFFVIVEKKCNIKRSNIDNYVKKTCDLVKEEKRTEYYLLYSNYTNGYDLKDYYLTDLKLPNNIKNYYNNFFIYTKNLLEGINILKNINIVHFDISFKNIRIESLTNKALLIDFGLSLNLNKIIKKKDLYGNIQEIDINEVITGFSINPITSPKYCFEIQIICYIVINNLINIRFKEENLLNIVENYYKKNTLFALFSESFKNEYITNIIKIHRNLINLNGIDVIKKCLNTWDSWDNFNLNYHFLIILYNLEYYHPLILDLIKLFTNQIHPNYNNRYPIENVLKNFNDILEDKKNMKSILDLKTSIQKMNYQKVGNSFEKSLKYL